MLGDNQQSLRNPKNGMSYCHNCFLSQLKTTDTLPVHSAAIIDMIVMEHKSGLLVVSCADDGMIKVWN